MFSVADFELTLAGNVANKRFHVVKSRKISFLRCRTQAKHDQTEGRTAIRSGRAFFFNLAAKNRKRKSDKTIKEDHVPHNCYYVVFDSLQERE